MPDIPLCDCNDMPDIHYSTVRMTGMCARHTLYDCDDGGHLSSDIPCTTVMMVGMYARHTLYDCHDDWHVCQTYPVRLS